MKSEERRNKIISILMAENAPVSGGELSTRLGISRQSIVQDITVLKAAGHEILSTNRGYLIKSNPNIERVFKVRHTSEQTQDELRHIVELGGMVVDVFVWHRVYGRIAAPLNIRSIRDIESFMEGIKSGKSTELMHITAGYHYHTIRAESEEALNRIGAMLKECQYAVEEI